MSQSTGRLTDATFTSRPSEHFMAGRVITQMATLSPDSGARKTSHDR